MKTGYRFLLHDRDIAPEGDNLIETNANLDKIVAMIKDYMRTSNTKLLWNTSNMFTHPRYVQVQPPPVMPMYLPCGPGPRALRSLLN